MTIQELEQKLNECQKELAELKESKKEGKWKPKDAEEYWFMDTDGNLMYSKFESENRSDRWRVENLPIFRTHGEAYRYWIFMDAVKEKSYEFSREEWEDYSINKYYIFYDFAEENFETGAMRDCKSFGEICFKTESDAQYIIDNFKDELFKYWL